MGRIRDPNRDKAFNIYKEHEGKIKPKALADLIGVKANIISQWKLLDKWDVKLGLKKKKIGAPKGNKNAKGNKGGAPKGNLNGFKHGSYINQERFKSKKFLEKYLPKKTYNMMNDVAQDGFNRIDELGTMIDLQFVTIINNRELMFIENKNDMTKILKKSGKGMKEYEIQTALDKQEKSINAQSKAMAVLTKMIKEYEELVHKNWDLATEEQKSRVEILKSKIQETSEANENIEVVFTRASEIKNE